MTETATEWSLRTWKQRHDGGYFPNSEEHRGWRICDAPPDWLMEYGKPTADDEVLEIGCGYGEWMIPLAPYIRYIWGIDIHESPLSMALTKFIDHNVVNANVTLSDGVTVPFPDSIFDLVYSISVLQHLPRSIVQGYLKESARVVKPGGRVLHHFRNANNVGPYPTPAKDIEVNHTGDFSVGWTAAEVLAAGEATGMRSQVHDIGLFLILHAERQ